MASVLRVLLSNVVNPIRTTSILSSELNWTQTRSYAARKGTREKARQKKVKIEQKKIAQAPKVIHKDKLKQVQRKRWIDDIKKDDPGYDNVYVMKYYKNIRYSLEEAIKNHQETHHPTMYNATNALLFANFELNMVAEKKTRFVDEFKRLVLLPNTFVYGEGKRVLVFTKTEELQKEAQEVGADLVGGMELIKNIESGDVSLADFDTVVAHTNIMTELVTIKGLLKRKFPNPKQNTLGNDLTQMVKRLKQGLQYECKKNGTDNDFGWIEAPIGTLDMGAQPLIENFNVLFENINKTRPKRSGKYITICWLSSPPSKERFFLDLKEYLQDDDTEEVVAATA